ncbi:F-box/LRR-repeat protein At4g14103-like [Phragmites australis]|uniref:F-box/LRR-repeat protein At4g14103-like n=1 Tax=Phragmites australis TaxID=29695 RepID=UPI002D776C5C|nr:F-box/LRR-repeat protein At4g14103-like [Phragmites australis]
MALLALQRLMTLQRDRQRRRRQVRARNGLIASVDKRKGSPCQQDGDGDSHAGKIMRYSIPDLPEDIWRHIHSLLPLRDAARAACLSHAFLHSWRCLPNLTLNRDVLCSEAHACGGKFSDKIDRILRNHSGCLKIFELDLDDLSCRYLDSWLRVAVTPGIEELTLRPYRRKYNFPCSLLSDGVRNSIRYLELGFCAFRPTAELGPLRSLTSLYLRAVHITGDELECLLSNALALEQFVLIYCKEIICLKIPCMLQQLSYLKVIGCWRLQVIESKAPNLSNFFLSGKILKLSLGETLQMKNLTMYHSNVVCYARAELSSTMPNLETVVLSSGEEVVNTPMLPTKFLYLKHLSIYMRSGLTFSPSYDYFSLVSFLDASPSLETLILDVAQVLMKHESVFGGSSHLRQMPEHRHCYLKSVKITGFSSAKGLVELACYILKNAVSLECLTLDTDYGFRCSGKNDTTCLRLNNTMLREAHRAVTAIRAYIEDKVPSTVKLTVLEPCRRCHARRGWPLRLRNKLL